MKWQVVEPTRGTYDWSGGDRLVQFAEQNHQQVRGHVLLWHNQLPDWLTAGVSDGTISNAQLRDLLHKHITDEVTHFKGKIWQWDVANEFFTDSNPSQINPNDFWISAPGRRRSSATPSAGPTRPTRRPCCSTTTTTSPARTVATPRATPSTPGSSSS